MADTPPPPLSQECKDIADEQTKRLRNIEKVLVSIAVSVFGVSLDDLDLEEQFLMLAALCCCCCFSKDRLIRVVRTESEYALFTDVHAEYLCRCESTGEEHTITVYSGSSFPSSSSVFPGGLS